jgi:arylsulfatase A
MMNVGWALLPDLSCADGASRVPILQKAAWTPNLKQIALEMKNLNLAISRVAAVLFVCLHATLTSAASPNIVVILVDDMGYGDAGSFNPDSKIATPNIDSLARDGMKFTDAHAPGPLCHMSRYGLMTGRYPFRANVGQWRKKPSIEKGQTTIASLAKSRGYHTAMVGKWHLGFLENGYENPLPGGPIDCGFNSFFGIRASTDIPPYFYIRGNKAVEPPTDHREAENSEGWTKIQGKFIRAGGIAPNLKLKDVLPRFTDEAVQVIKDHDNSESKKPLMLYLAYPAPHTPWIPSKEFVGKSGAGMYGDFLMMVDAQIGRVLSTLRDAGMSKDTLLVFTSDNGPVWYDADEKRFGHASVGKLRGMKADAWEGGHRMPFIVRWPDQVKAGTISERTICFTDLLATFAEVMKADLPKDAGPDSFSFLPALTGIRDAKPDKRPAIVMRPGVASTMMIRSGDWKLINQLGSGGFSKPNRIKSKPGEPAGQLYNLADDLGETKNLYLDHPEIVKRLTREMQDIVKSGRSRP